MVENTVNYLTKRNDEVCENAIMNSLKLGIDLTCNSFIDASAYIPTIPLELIDLLPSKIDPVLYPLIRSTLERLLHQKGLFLVQSATNLLNDPVVIKMTLEEIEKYLEVVVQGLKNYEARIVYRGNNRMVETTTNPNGFAR